MASTPVSSQLVMTFGNNSPGMAILNWEDYSYSSDFLIPCDAFTMKVGDQSISPQMRQLIQGGQQVQLQMQILDVNANVISSNVIFTGFVDQITLENDRKGTFYTLRGRNFLGPLCDSGIDPWSSTYKFVDGQTLGDVIGTVMNTFNITEIWLTDVVNRQITTGIDKNKATLTTSTFQVTTEDVVVDESDITVTPTTTSTTITQYIDPTNIYDLSETSIKKLQPKHDMTYMQFVEENLARFGVTCWAMADGSGIVIGAPDYTQQPLYTITNKLNGQGNNVLMGKLEIDPFNMPQAIIAKGYSGGGDFQNTRIRTCKINEYNGYVVDNSDPTFVIGPNSYNGNYDIQPALQTKINLFKGLQVLAPNVALAQSYSQFFTPPPVPKIVYWEDEKSRTLDQLNNAVMRKMSEFQRAGFRLHYDVQDHAQNGIVWTKNTIVNVYDEVLGILDEQFWILGVHYKKSRSAGTITELTMIPVGTLILGPKGSKAGGTSTKS
jgi:prophage tail gpP-like protein